jgi:hypothetical protein
VNFQAALKAVQQISDDYIDGFLGLTAEELTQLRKAHSSQDRETVANVFNSMLERIPMDALARSVAARKQK